MIQKKAHRTAVYGIAESMFHISRHGICGKWSTDCENLQFDHHHKGLYNKQKEFG